MGFAEKIYINRNPRIKTQTVLHPLVLRLSTKSLWKHSSCGNNVKKQGDDLGKNTKKWGIWPTLWTQSRFSCCAIQKFDLGNINVLQISTVQVPKSNNILCWLVYKIYICFFFHLENKKLRRFMKKFLRKRPADCKVKPSGLRKFQVRSCWHFLNLLPSGMCATSLQIPTSCWCFRCPDFCSD